MPGSVDVILGVDFGTRFSKICYRILDGSRPALVSTESHVGAATIMDSVLWVDPAKHFITSLPGVRPERLLPLFFLKMLLMESKEAADQPVLKLGFMQPLRRTVPALSAFLLSRLIRRSILAILQKERKKLDSKEVRWSLNLSIPAQHADDGLRPIFREVGSVALKWAVDAVAGEREGLLTPTVEKVREKYGEDTNIAVKRFYVSVTPEIVAALHHFMRRAQTPEGVHGFLDIGAGTIDACIFRISRYGDEPTVPILSARVANLGTASIANTLASAQDTESRNTLEAILVSPSQPSSGISAVLSTQQREVETFAATVALRARDGILGQALVHDPVQFYGGDLRQLDRTFQFHSTGGGAQSAWYRSCVEGVYGKRNLRSANLMRWSVGAAQPPSDFPTTAADFNRFIIAWGLTAEDAALEELRMFLPSQLQPLPPQPEAQRRVPVYEGR